MSGFSADWLALREPADHRARNPGVAHMLGRSFGERESLSICDLGAGTGSSLRALAPLLPERQRWRLVDSDPALLAAARSALVGWADSGDDLRLEAGQRVIDVELVEGDLTGDLDELLPPEVDLVNSSALIDLVSEPWLERLVAAARRRRAAVLMALAYAGIERWLPAHPADPAMLAAFNAHQRGDKGFGPALGRTAAEALAHKLKAGGYEVVLAPSPWQLTARRDAALIALLAEGIARAVRETGQLEPGHVESWLAARRSAASAEIAHIDLFARLP